MSVKIRNALNDQDVEAACSFMAKVFGPNYFDAQKNVARSLKLEKLIGPKEFTIAVLGSEIVGATRSLPKPCYIGGRAVEATGITYVCVHPDYRAQGIATRMLEHAHQEAALRDCVLAVTFARRAVDGFYPKLGYAGVGNYHEMTVLISSTADKGLKKSSIKLVPNVDEQNLHEYSQAYKEIYGLMPLAFVRDDEWWVTVRERLEARCCPFKFFNAYIDGRFAGYCIIVNDCIIELAGPKAHISSLTEAILWESAGQTQSLIFKLPVQHPSILYLRKYNYLEKNRCSWDGGHMIKVLDGRKLMNSFAESLAEPISFEPRQLSSSDGIRKLFLSHIESLAVNMRPNWSVVDEF